MSDTARLSASACAKTRRWTTKKMQNDMAPPAAGDTIHESATLVSEPMWNTLNPFVNNAKPRSPPTPACVVDTGSLANDARKRQNAAARSDENMPRERYAASPL
eukprot:Amastigsp_a676366_8.p6 type:complete len:104 gc:universal Amastigsp_a676366_8:468-157(-)